MCFFWCLIGRCVTEQCSSTVTEAGYLGQGRAGWVRGLTGCNPYIPPPVTNLLRCCGDDVTQCVARPASMYLSHSVCSEPPEVGFAPVPARLWHIWVTYDIAALHCSFLFQGNVHTVCSNDQNVNVMFIPPWNTENTSDFCMTG